MEENEKIVKVVNISATQAIPSMAGYEKKE